MPQKHRAYIFKVQKVKTSLGGIIDKNDLYKPSRKLVKVSQAIYQQKTEQVIEILDYLRIDDKWFGNLYSYVNGNAESFFTYLASFMKRAPDLSSSLPFSYCILESVLQYLKWSEGDIRYLVKGEKINTLIKSIELPQETAYNMAHYGMAGWLGLEEIFRISNKLSEFQDAFIYPSQEIIEIVHDLESLYYISPGDGIRKSYFEMKAMYDYAIQNESDLFLILD